MKILATNVYVGPSLYAHFPVIRHQVDIGVLEEWPSVRLGPEFIDGLVRHCPGFANHGCSYGEPGGFLRRLSEDEGTWMAHIWEHASIELQNMAGSDVSFGKTRGMGATSATTTWCLSTSSRKLVWRRPGLRANFCSACCRRS